MFGKCGDRPFEIELRIRVGVTGRCLELQVDSGNHWRSSPIVALEVGQDVAGNPEDPGGVATGGRVARPGLVGAEKDFLAQFFGVGRISHTAADVPEHGWVVALEEVDHAHALLSPTFLQHRLPLKLSGGSWTTHLCPKKPVAALAGGSLKGGGTSI